jgi:hypothetical protein
MISAKTARRSSYRLKIIASLFCFLPILGIAQIPFTSGSLTYNQDFNSLNNTGTSSVLPSGWALFESGSNANITYGADDGGSTTGDTYSYGADASTERAFGGLFSGSLTPTIGASFINNTGGTITALAITYTGEQWRLGSTGRNDRLDFQYSLNASSLNTGTWTDVNALDFTAPNSTGTVGQLDGNVMANRATITFTINGLTISNTSTLWIRWSDFNASGSDDGLAIDEFTITATYLPSNGPNLSANPNSLSNLDYVFGNGPSISKSYVLEGSNLTGDITVTPPTNFEISNTSASSGFTTSPLILSPTGGAINTTIHARLVSGLAVNPAYAGAISHSGGGLASTVSASLSGMVTAASAITKINAIQGSGSTAALLGAHTIEGIVTRSFLGSSQLDGFFVQEEDTDSDGDPNTSEGIFVYDPNGLFTGNQGDKVQVKGQVIEYVSGASSLTEMTSLSSVLVISTGNVLPSVTNVQLPVTQVSDLERYEGMLVNMTAATGQLTVTEYYQLGQYGQVLLSVEGSSNQPGTDARLDQFTQFNAPSVSGYSTYLTEIAKRRIYLDDGSSLSYPDPILFGRGGNPLSASNPLRGGDEVANITAILDHRFEGYRLQTRTGVNFQATNPRPATPPSVGGSLKVAGFNVLNYFNGPTFPTSRGADNTTEFTRQRNKTLQAIINSGADILALNELENDGYTSSSAIADLVNGLNAIAGAGTYAYINPGTAISTDQITVGIIYRTAKVQPSGSAATIPNAYGNGSFDIVGRKPLAQTFMQVSNAAKLTVVTAHFKSKGSSSGGAGDSDAGDGQGFSNGTRTRQSQDLTNWLATNPTGTTDPDYILLGDINAYAMENPITTIESAGYTAVLPNSSYSYVFDGQVGSLDHAFVSTSLATQVVGSTKWHINADEPGVLDYNTENKTSSQITSLYNADPYRSSDHDPVLIGLNLTASFVPVELITFNSKPHDDTVLLNWETATEINNDYFSIQHATDGRIFREIGQVKGQETSHSKTQYAFSHTTPSNGFNYYRLKQVDRDGAIDYSKIVSTIFLGKQQIHSLKRVYPSIVQSELTIEYDLFNSEDARLIILDGFGRIAYSTILSHTLGQKRNLDISDLPPGFYILKLAAPEAKAYKFYKM